VPWRRDQNTINIDRLDGQEGPQNEDDEESEGDEEINVQPPVKVNEVKASPKKLIKSHKNHIVMGSGNRAMKNYSTRQRKMLKQAITGGGPNGGSMIPHDLLSSF
jgi:hypothetical protein